MHAPRTHTFLFRYVVQFQVIFQYLAGGGKAPFSLFIGLECWALATLCCGAERPWLLVHGALGDGVHAQCRWLMNTYIGSVSTTICTILY